MVKLLVWDGMPNPEFSMEFGCTTIHPRPQNPQLATSRELPTLALSFGALYQFQGTARHLHYRHYRMGKCCGFLTNVHTLKHKVYF